MNEGAQETSGKSFKRISTSLKKQKQLLTVRLQNLHITEYRGKSYQVFFHDEKVSMTLLTKPQNISIGHRSLFVFLYAFRGFKVIL